MAGEEVSAEELTALVQAIKFAHPEFTLKQVHNQVLTHGGKFESVPVTRIKKYLKKLGLMGNMNAAAADDKSEPVSLMTVGGDSKSAIPAGASPLYDSSHYVPVPLDVPAMQVSAHPHQAVIRMTPETATGLSEGSLGEIYKIQKAMSDGSDEQFPMLMYNKDRSRKTFLHPTTQPAYTKIAHWIDQQGQGGVGGGTKAYFYGRVQGGATVFVNTHTLAESQPW
ncbi:Aste57867_11170 [Aphanomyces stellatus]|uniref:Aste57867_11170 protein n=1 Tax=Aphanomyces stellatus TaxID=120398 RepID=A0A485KSR3_9STRA|nr:hypothetical protein As57867_011128 [Aphanomyces stellatus]VFT88037.1 Aste57867_11170 [Aphanomyces stellatus]